MRPSVSRYININVATREQGKPFPFDGSSVKRLIMPKDIDVFRVHIRKNYVLNGIVPISTLTRIVTVGTVPRPVNGFLSVSDSPQRSLLDGFKLFDSFIGYVLNPNDPTQLIESYNADQELILDRRGQQSYMQDDLYLYSFIPAYPLNTGETLTQIASVCFEGYLK
jgi:hypothetical protein